MSDQPASVPRITVRAVPIELAQFLKFSGLAETGGAAKQAIAEGRVRLNGVVETQKAKKLTAGDRVTLDGRTVEVHVA